MLSSVACLALPHFSTLSYRVRHDFGGKCIELELCVLILSTTVLLLP